MEVTGSGTRTANQKQNRPTARSATRPIADRPSLRNQRLGRLAGALMLAVMFNSTDQKPTANPPEMNGEPERKGLFGLWITSHITVNVSEVRPPMLAA